MKTIIFGLAILASTVLLAFKYSSNNQKIESPDTNLFNQNKLMNRDIDYFLDYIKNPKSEAGKLALEKIDETWNETYEIMALEVMYFSRNEEDIINMISLLRTHTGQDIGYDPSAWYAYLWDKDEKLSPNYHEFKAEIHGKVDERFYKYFKDRQDQTTIRWDEIRWGGVLQDGIPPLRQPEMISADKADYLGDQDVVFGIAVNGDVRAYPKRILAWHEMFVDDVGGVPVAGVYCTLCGTVILYKTEHNGVNHEIGTSGFLYRSNKLMYDKATQSLWNTIGGSPAVGPLVGKGIELEYLSVVTTTWGEWKARHPETSVLSLNTGHYRNYDEGEAYRSYFATDELMFNVPNLDKTLNNKESILAIRLIEYPDMPIAVSTTFLNAHPLYEMDVEDRHIVVLTDKTGANRVYDAQGFEFKSYDGNSLVIDENGTEWTLMEDHLIDADGNKLLRLRSYNAFWFGFKAAYPDTKLIN